MFKYKMKAHKYIAEYVGGPDVLKKLFAKEMSELESLDAICHFIIAGSDYTMEDLDDMEVTEIFAMFQEAVQAWVKSKVGKLQEEKAPNPPMKKKSQRKKTGPS